jgi:hypothetical protein
MGLSPRDSVGPATADRGMGASASGLLVQDPHDCSGADHVVFNSYVNTPNYGDERAFFDAKPLGSPRSQPAQDVISVVPGERVLMRIYVDNDAWEGRVQAQQGVAVDTRARVEIPLSASRRHLVFAFVSADNARPPEVYDGVTIVSKEPTEVRYVFGSGMWNTRDKTWSIPDELMEDGTPIGSRAADGQFGDDFADSGILSFMVIVRSPSGNSGA